MTKWVLLFLLTSFMFFVAKYQFENIHLTQTQVFIDMCKLKPFVGMKDE